MPEQQTFDLAAGEREKKLGMARAASRRPEILYNARTLAWWLCKTNGEVTVDDVYRALEGSIYDCSKLGPAAGSIFKGKQWVCVGWRKSTRVSNHGRVIRVWKLK
jgi:hypothetical protein